jgi:hypothetical protein
VKATECLQDEEMFNGYTLRISLDTEDDMVFVVVGPVVDTFDRSISSDLSSSGESFVIDVHL